MKNKIIIYKFDIMLLVIFILVLPSYAQQILLDKPVRAGELTLFPDLTDTTLYYYVSDKVSLATDEHGRPQFSFMRYVENIRSETGQTAQREGAGGGIVHAVVSLKVTEDQLAEAESELKSIKPGSRIQGPVVYRSGKFGLITSFTDENKKLTTQLLGIGNAPILDGQKAAVSLHLTKLGARILWESFKMSNPDISFTFEMKMSGYQSPYKALLEGNWDQIYNHKAFSAGLSYMFISADIMAAFEDCRRNGAIKLTQIGGDDNLDALIRKAYDKVQGMMFKEIQVSQTPKAAIGKPAKRNEESSDRFINQIIEQNKRNIAQLTDQKKMIEEKRNQIKDNESKVKPANDTSKPDQNDKVEKSEVPESTNNSKPANNVIKKGKKLYIPLEESKDAKLDVVKPDPKALAAKDKTKSAPISEDKKLSIKKDDAKSDDKQSQSDESPSILGSILENTKILATFEMKKIRRSGAFKFDFNKYTKDELVMRFDENIGNLNRYLGNKQFFREVNLDDPLYRQREIVAMFDGLNASDFDKYINYVSVQLYKKHESGEESEDEILIHRKDFNEKGNNYKLLYGWKNDRKRSRWLEYEVKTKWSFFGGYELELPTEKTTFSAISLIPPFQRRLITIDAEPEAITAARVRSITVRIFYKLGDTEQVEQIALNPSKGRLSEQVEIILPPNEYEYEYEIIWRIRGNKTISSGRHTTTEEYLYADELPL